MSITKTQLGKSKYKNDINYFITNHDLDKIIHNVKIVKFADLEKYESIYDLLPKKIDFVVILTETEGVNTGHWQLLLRNNNVFEFFDSYGDEPKTIIKFITKKMNQYLGNDYNKDMGHILKSIKPTDKLIINKYEFQSDTNDVNTCGRWVASRIINFMLGMDNKQYINWFKGIKKQNPRLKNDEIISELIKINI
jgi:hypothetical protein